MKTAVTTDLLTERNLAVEIVQTFLETYDESTLYTLAHRPGEILGPVEHRKITSSYLTHKIQTVDDVRKHGWMVPGAAKKLHIPCSTDLILNVSRGLSHGISKCDRPKQITYLLDDACLPVGGQGKSWREKIFGAMVRSWALNAFKQADEIWLAHEGLEPLVSNRRNGVDVKIVPPFIRTQDFPAGPKNVFEHNYYVINAQGVDFDQAKRLMELFSKRGTPYLFVGEDSHLNSLKTAEKAKLFYGAKCNGELAPLLAGSRAAIDLSKTFPLIALSALCSGRPVISSDNPFIDKKLEEKAVVKLGPDENLEKVLDQMDHEFTQYDPQVLHNSINKFHQAKFKGEVHRIQVP